jgi:hypothetical protein
MTASGSGDVGSLPEADFFERSGVAPPTSADRVNANSDGPVSQQAAQELASSRSDW